MSQKQPLTLNTPARKLFACQLLQKQHDGGIQWLRNNDNLTCNQVWLQGIVVLVSADGNDLFLDDGTGIIQANGVTKIVKDLFIHKGTHY